MASTGSERRAGDGIASGGSTRMEGAGSPGGQGRRAAGPLTSEGRQRDGLDGYPVRLQRGDCGPAVHRWQMVLSRAGLLDDPSGTFDDLTEMATRSWQQQRDVQATGVVGASEWAEMEAEELEAGQGGGAP